MYMLSIVFGPSPVPWGLLFRDKELADAAYQTLLSGDPTKPISITDDFGQCAHVERRAIHGVMLEDMEKSKLGMIERALHQERLKVKANEMARVDPVLKTAAMTQGAPILQPFGGRPNGGF